MWKMLKLTMLIYITTVFQDFSKLIFQQGRGGGGGGGGGEHGFSLESPMSIGALVSIFFIQYISYYGQEVI